MRFVFIMTLLFTGASCNKLVELPTPKDRLINNNVYSTDETAIAVLNGIYINMSQAYGGISSRLPDLNIGLLLGLSADEFTLFSGATNPKNIAYFQNKLSTFQKVGSEIWSPLYKHLFQVNSAIENLEASAALTNQVKQQLIGEAKFLRAFYYFYLVNCFGDVPLALSSNYRVNSMLARSDVSSVYAQIVLDLKEAQSLLSSEYLNKDLQQYSGLTERIRPTKWAAAALLARVYLFTEQWADAVAQASIVINHTNLFTLPPLNDCFLKNSQESIWQLQPVNNSFNTSEARNYVIPTTGFTEENPVSLSNDLLSSFEQNDQRRFGRNWIDSNFLDNTWYYYPFKYKIDISDPLISGSSGSSNMTEYLTVLRLGEQYLIRAEARAHLEDLLGAAADLNSIRVRAGLTDFIGSSSPIPLLSAIMHERQVELFSEWGHRWLDLKRTKSIDNVMSVVTPKKANGFAWQSYQKLYPLPIEDIQKAPNLSQTPGY